ncbi:F0F1 ATP synthase subunit A [soil metagenome]
MSNSHFTWFDAAGISHEYTYVAANITVTALLVLFAVVSRAALGAGEKASVPAGSFGVKGFTETLVEFIDDLVTGTLGPGTREYVPLFGSIFFFVIMNNLFGLLPGMTAATGNINTALAIGVFSFFVYNYMGLKHGGWHYLAHFAGPVWWLAWLMIPIEIISHLIRPFSLGIRLSVNMTADHTILGTFIDLTKVVVPVVFYGLGTFVSFIQALVFTMLSMVYVAMATADEH